MLLRSSDVRRVLVGSVSSLALAFWAHSAAANPTDGVVEAGSAEISAPNPGTLVINQTSDKAIINWGSFDVGLGEQTRFVLPGHTSVTLNRDFSGDASEILGSVTSNGRFYLVNPNGILFGRDARVDVAGLVATTHDIRSSDFLADRLDFSMAGEPGASVINQGQIRVDDLGFGAFVAPHVRNDGAVVAHMGKVELASASGFTLDLRGDSLISFLVENPNQYGILDANGQPVTALVENTGNITADGGQVVLRAAAARGVVDSVINTDGIIQANTVEHRGGKIVLGGGGAGSVKVKGKVTARGNEAGENGGEIIVTGTLLTADQTAMLDASGWAGGGKILFGGDYLGGKATNEDAAKFRFVMEDEALQTSAGVLLEEGAQLKADALVDGNGGKVVVWSDNLTSTAADISARGGSSSGDGGFIETSSAGVLDVRTAADTSASNGQSGAWLLDPLNITIDDPASANSRWQLTADDLFSFFPAGVFLADVFRPTSTGSVLSSAIIEDALNDGTNVVVTTRDTVGSGEGNIRVSTGITKTSGGDARLSLIASNDVIIDAGVEVLSFSGKLDIELNAETGSIIGTNLGNSFLAGGALLMLARDGIQFSTSSIMPENFYLVVNNISTALNQVDIAFGLDRFRFGYNSSNLELGTGGITLIEDMATGNASFIGFSRPVNVHLSDRAIVGITDPMSFPRVWNIDNTRSWSAVNRNALNGIPEIEGFSGVSLSFGAEPGSSFTAVVEVSERRDGTTDRRIVTAPSGQTALNNFLAGPATSSPVDLAVKQAQLNENLQSTSIVKRTALWLGCQVGLGKCASGLSKARERDILDLLRSIKISGDYVDVLVEGRLSEISSKAGVSYWELFGALLDATEALDELRQGNYVDGVAGLSGLAAGQIIKRTPAGGAVFSAFGTANLFALPVEAALNFLVNSLDDATVNEQQKLYDLLRDNDFTHTEIMKQGNSTRDPSIFVSFTPRGFIGRVLPNESGPVRAGDGIASINLETIDPRIDRDKLFNSFEVAYNIKKGIYAAELEKLKEAVMADFINQTTP